MREKKTETGMNDYFLCTIECKLGNRQSVFFLNVIDSVLVLFLSSFEIISFQLETIHFAIPDFDVITRSDIVMLFVLVS